MPRTIDATLAAAMASGSYTPYFSLVISQVGGGTVETKTPVYYKLTPTTLTVKYQRTSDLMYSYGPNDLEMLLTRGVTVSGVNYTVDTSHFFVINASWDGQYQVLEGCLLPEQYFTAPGDQHYDSVINYVCATFGKTAVYKHPTDAWLDYQFLPDGRTFVLPKVSNLFNVLKQKYLIYACDNGNDEILFETQGMARTYTPDHTISVYHFVYRDFVFYKQFLSRDENNTVHKSGSDIAPYFNLGYLESTDSHPDVDYSAPKHEIQPLPVNLAYLSLDRFKLNFPNLSALHMNAEVTEIFDPSRKELAWHVLLENYHWAENTEGGAMPSTIEAAAPYTPLNTSTFNNVLSDKDNNIQSAMETIDNQTRRVIFGDEDYYVRTDGLDTNDGTEDNTDHAWLTIQHALDVIGTFDLNSHAVKIHIADGTYTITSQLLIPSNVGGGVIWLTGNPGTPSNVVIQGNTGWCVFQNISPGVRVFLEGLKFTGTGGTWVGLQCSNLSYTRFWWCEFGTGLYINIYIADGAQVVGYWDYTISASCYCHVYSAKFGTFSMNGGMTVTLTGAPAWTVGFVFMDELSDFSGSGVIFSGAATGPRYMVALNSVINTGGGGAAYFPGNAAGTATTGGQYV